mmetsp:Transcript_107923/g.287330  ORF Transcript_107923/g.287330 Transcript_107923/m.287330 type:complete len:722 (-) Transcript_107923:128-2293(-)
MAGAPGFAVALLLLVACAGGSTVHGGSVAGVQKVVQMLKDMEATSMQAKKDEEVAFAKFSTWCEQETASLKGDVGKNYEEIQLLNGEIAKLESDISTLDDAIGALNDKVAKEESDMKAETAQREKDHADFLAEEQDYSESADALERAIAFLQKQSYDRPAAAAALLQLSENSRVPAKAKSLIAAFVNMMGSVAGEASPDRLSYEAPEANAYEFQSGGIVDLLKKLKDQFRTKLGESQKEEMNSKHAYDMIIMDLTDSTENAKKEIGEKTAEKARKAEKAALDKKQLAATTSVKEENENTLAATTTECSEKKLSFAEKQKLRVEEIEAIQKAVEILLSPEVAGNAEKYLSMAQARSGPTSFVQMGENQASRVEGVHKRIREFLAAEASRLHSQRLGLLAEKMAANPFAKVTKMIDAMITRLTEEANEDAQHEGFCDKEMGKSKITRNKLSEEIDGLTAAVEEGKATTAALAESIAELSKEVAELVRSMEEATEMRKTEKVENAATVKDAQEAQAAVQAATAVLKDYYAKASTATAFVQAPSPRQWGLKTGVKMGTDEWNSLANPSFQGSVDKGHKESMQTFGSVEKGQQDENEYGVIALLQVIQSDFANLEADTKASETESQQAYERLMAELNKSKAVKDRKIDMNNADKAAAESKLREDTADMKSNQDELLAAERYYERLVPQCIDQGMTFEERTMAREAEIASLKQALDLLSSEDIATSA